VCCLCGKLSDVDKSTAQYQLIEVKSYAFRRQAEITDYVFGMEFKLKKAAASQEIKCCSRTHGPRRKLHESSATRMAGMKIYDNCVVS